MPTIRQLSQSMINKIAAGEVIERPASVMKELAENAIDAGATRIDIGIENGGADLVRIVDNGCGIAAEQLDLALSPHATSKIADTDDLFKIATFGFRGEALASVAEISQMMIKSRIAESSEGAAIQCNGGERGEPVPYGLPVGTQIEVRNLFFNTPVRRKYMRSTTTEFGHITETFTRLVLPLPNIHFTLKHNNRSVYDLPATTDSVSRIRQLFGEETARDLIAVESPPQAVVKVSGFVSHPKLNRPNNRMQYFFLNHRYIRDKSLQHALNEAYRGMLLGGRFPIAFLQIELPTELFDVNVHPAKMEVRFLDASRIYSGFLTAIREKFLKVDLRSGVHSDKVSNAAIDPLDPRSAMDENTRSTVLDWMTQIESGRNESAKNNVDKNNLNKSGLAPTEQKEYRDSYRNADYSRSSWDRNASALPIHRLPERPYRDTDHANGQATYQATQTSASSQNEYKHERENDAPTGYGSSSDDRVTFTSGGHLAVQMLDRFIVMELDNGIAIIDQHALHERILYEQMKERRQSGRLESQRLLVPIPVDLAPNELSCVLEDTAFFKTLGLEVEPFGGNTVLISAFPSILSKTPPKEILLSLLEPLMNTGKKPDQSELIDEMLHSLACKAAIKAGDKLRSDAMEKLLKLAEEEMNSHHCPHGRPSTLVFTKEEIDKMFLRI